MRMVSVEHARGSGLIKELKEGVSMEILEREMEEEEIKSSAEFIDC